MNRIRIHRSPRLLAALATTFALGTVACGSDATDDDDGSTNMEVMVQGVVVDPDVFIGGQIMGLTTEEARAAGARAGIPIAADVRPDVRVVTDASGKFSLSVPANTKIRLLTYENDDMTYLPTHDNVVIDVGTEDVTDALTFVCSSQTSGPVRLAEDLGISVDEMLTRGYCAVNAFAGSFPGLTFIENITGTVNTPGFKIVGRIATPMGLEWLAPEEMTTTSSIALFGVFSDSPISEPTDVSITFTDNSNNPPYEFAPFTCQVRPGFGVYSRPAYATE